MTQKEQIKLIQTAVSAAADGVIGSKTLKALCNKLSISLPEKTTKLEMTKLIQKKVNVIADGKIGPKTLTAIISALNIKVPTAAATSTGIVKKPSVTPIYTWPTQAQVRSGKSIFGKPGDESNLVSLVPPYQMYYDGTPYKAIRLNKAIAKAVEEALKEVLTAYGPEKIHELGLDVYDGCFNYRSTRSGSSLSMHAWGIAIDFDAAHNAMQTHAPKARFSHPEYQKWWDIWTKYGFASMGLTYDKDWMHVQAARF